MMHKERSKFIFECDCCDETFDDYAEDSFQDLIQRLKDAGWRIAKQGAEWIHLCPQHRDTKI